MQSPTTRTAVAHDGRPNLSPIGGRYFALAVLFSMNLLNYVDRYSFFAVGTHIQSELDIKNRGYGVLSAAFMIVYTLVSPLMGWLGDRYNRRVLLATGVGLWSVATVGTAFSRGFTDMFFWRALLGVGEATYGVIALALLADLFEPRLRNRAMGLYTLALPLGGALGYIIGGRVADTWGWRLSFWVVGLPGIFAALAALMIRDPGRGASEGQTRAGATRPTFHDYLDVFRTPTFLFNTAGMAAVTFATGAYAAWGSTFYQTVRGMTTSQAGDTIGVMTAIAGLLGIAAGTWLAELLSRWTRRAYLLMACCAVVAATPLGLAAILDPQRGSALAVLFGAMILMATVLGPCNTVTANVVPPNRRAVGYAGSIFLIHLFGDISSPIFIGVIADWLGAPAMVLSPIGRALSTLGAVPVGATNLTAGMLAVAPVLALGAVFFLLGSRHLPADQDRAHAAGGPDNGALTFH
jgi:MFS transporter, Spinster family, sphingosine-1-phosphate transporter